MSESTTPARDAGPAAAGCARCAALHEAALRLNADLPASVMLAGDGTIHITRHGNAGSQLRAITQEEVIRIIHTAITATDRMISRYYVHSGGRLPADRKEAP